MNTDLKFSAHDAVELYERLQKMGQTSILARLSVESRLTDLPAAERRHVHNLLMDVETGRKPLFNTTTAEARC